MTYIDISRPEGEISDKEMEEALSALSAKFYKKKDILILPPDQTRLHSKAGEITTFLTEQFGDAVKDIMPTLGTHNPMSSTQIEHMYGSSIDKSLFREHKWRDDTTEIGTVPSSFIEEISEGICNLSVRLEINKLLLDGGHDLILSIGQVVPHEVVGMANHSKNILVGAGGRDIINKSHFLGAAYGMERIMGRTDSPVRKLFDYSMQKFASSLPLVYILTVLSPDESGIPRLRGLFAGDDRECFERAADLAFKVNITIVEKPIKKAVVYLDPSEYKSTWLGNKAVYRTRMAIADGGELLILAPGLKEFGEDQQIDKLIRQFGYVRSKEVMDLVARGGELAENLCAAAHLIHGSSHGRFKITYCSGHLNRQEIESVHYNYGELKTWMEHYDPLSLKEGWNTMDDGEEIFFISNPALGLWSTEEKFKEEG